MAVASCTLSMKSLSTILLSSITHASIPSVSTNLLPSVTNTLLPCTDASSLTLTAAIFQPSSRPPSLASLQSLLTTSLKTLPLGCTGTIITTVSFSHNTRRSNISVSNIFGYFSDTIFLAGSFKGFSLSLSLSSLSEIRGTTPPNEGKTFT